MSRSWVSVLALAMAGMAFARSELVIVKNGTTTYHRPACPVIRDGRDVTAMTRGQAESRGYKAHADCDPARVAPAASGAAKPKPPAPAVVYVSPGDEKYHRQTCSRLGADRRKVTVEEAATSRHWPCPICKPPIRKKGEPSVPPRYPRG